MLFALGKRRRAASRKNRRVRPKQTLPATLKESESSSASPPASIVTSTSVEDYNPDIPASQDQEQSDGPDSPASQGFSFVLIASDGSKLRIEYSSSHPASSPDEFPVGKFPVGPPDFETALKEGGGQFYFKYNPSRSEELGWIFSWFTVPDSYRKPEEISTDSYDDIPSPDWPEVPTHPRTLDEIFADVEFRKQQTLCWLESAEKQQAGVA